MGHFVSCYLPNFLVFVLLPLDAIAPPLAGRVGRHGRSLFFLDVAVAVVALVAVVIAAAAEAVLCFSVANGAVLVSLGDVVVVVVSAVGAREVLLQQGTLWT